MGEKKERELHNIQKGEDKLELHNIQKGEDKLTDFL